MAVDPLRLSETLMAINRCSNTPAGGGARLMLLVHHDDAAREYAYDRDSRVGHLDEALDAAKQQGWTVVSMKNDWKHIFAWEK